MASDPFDWAQHQAVHHAAPNPWRVHSLRWRRAESRLSQRHWSQNKSEARAPGRWEMPSDDGAGSMDENWPGGVRTFTVEVVGSNIGAKSMKFSGKRVTVKL